VSVERVPERQRDDENLKQEALFVACQRGNGQRRTIQTDAG